MGMNEPPENPLDVARRAVDAHFSPALKRAKVVEETIQMIANNSNVTSGDEAVVAFGVAMKALVEAFPGTGYDAWLPPTTAGQAPSTLYSNGIAKVRDAWAKAPH